MPSFLALTLARGESIGTVGIDHAGLIVSYEELYVPLLQEVQNLIGGE